MFKRPRDNKHKPLLGWMWLKFVPSMGLPEEIKSTRRRGRY
jgi:hypothetical protein